jgi:hypothetical protein
MSSMGLRWEHGIQLNTYYKEFVLKKNIENNQKNEIPRMGKVSSQRVLRYD